MLKRLLIILIAALMLAACKPSDIDDEYYKYGMKALEIVDSYLDFEINANEAYEQMNELFGREETLPDNEIGNDNFLKNLDVKSAVFNINIDLRALTREYGDHQEDHEELKRNRNKLADALGEDLIDAKEAPEPTSSVEEDSVEETAVTTTTPSLMPEEDLPSCEQELKDLLSKEADLESADLMIGESAVTVNVHLSKYDMKEFVKASEIAVNFAKDKKSKYGSSFRVTISTPFDPKDYASWVSEDLSKGTFYDGASSDKLTLDDLKRIYNVH